MSLIERIEHFQSEYLKVDSCICVDVKKGGIILGVTEWCLVIATLNFSRDFPFFIRFLIFSALGSLIFLFNGIYNKKPSDLLLNLFLWMVIHAASVLAFVVVTLVRLLGALHLVDHYSWSWILTDIVKMHYSYFWITWLLCAFFCLCSWFIASVKNSLFMAMDKEQKENAAKLSTATAPTFGDMHTVELNRF